MATEQDKQLVRMLVRSRKDFQQMRKANDNRLARKADGTEQKNASERLFWEGNAKDEDDAKKKKGDAGMIAEIADAARKQEKVIERRLEKVLERFPVYTEYLEHVNAVGTIAAGWIVAEFDIHKATTVSKLWQYSGLNPSMVRGKKRIKVKDYKPSQGKILKELYDKDGDLDAYVVLTDEMVRGDSYTKDFILPFNKDLRTALLGVMAPSIKQAGIRWIPCDEDVFAELPEHMRSRRTKKIEGEDVKNVPCIRQISCPYCQIYIDYKNRLAHSTRMTTEYRGKNKPPVKVMWKDATPRHRELASLRYMIKMFLRDLYVAWRPLEGLPVRGSYQEEKLGHSHGG